MDALQIPFPGEAGSNPDMKRFWDACNQDKLLLTRCRQTARVFAYPRSISPFTLSSDVEWFEASGTGVIYSFSTTMGPAQPYTIAYVLLEEGVCVLTGIVDCAHEALEIGQNVHLVFKAAANGQRTPFFTPA